MSDKQEKAGFPMGGGEMGRLMREHDWSTSSLGSPEQWPEMLRAAVSLMIDSAFPMCIAWGPELALLYNDAYACLLGERRVTSLGRKASDVWSKVWPVVQPLVDRVMTGEAVYFEDQPLPLMRDGREERGWFTFSYSPMRDAHGTIAGLYCTCTETTAKVLNQRRQAFRIRFEDQLRFATTPEEIIGVTSAMLGSELNASRAGFIEMEADGEFLHFHPDWTDGQVARLAGRRFSITAFRPALVAELLAGRTVVTYDAQQRGFTGDGASPYADLGSRAGITIPLIREGTFMAALYLHSAHPRHWRADEEMLVREIAERAWDAIKRSRAEKAQHESERRFRNMANHVPVMIWTTNRDGHCNYLNPAWYDFTGQSEEEAFGFGWTEAIHPDDRDTVRKTFIQDSAQQSPARLEYRLRRRDGSYRRVLDVGAPRFDDNGTFLGYVGSVIDIDELKSAQAALVASNARFRAAIDAIEGVLWTNDAEGQMAGEQPGWAALTGQPEHEYQGVGWQAVIHPDDVQPTVDAWKKAVAERRAFVFEHRLRRRDGEWRHYSIRAIPTFDGDGKVLEWVGVHTDVTELRRSENMLRQLNARLETGIAEVLRERDRLWGMSQDILAVASMNGYFLAVNPAFTATLGWSEQEALSIPFFELTHPDHRADLGEKLAVLGRGLPLVQYEVRDLHKDGSFRWLSWTIVPEGDLLYGVARDITVEKKQSDALRHAEDALRQAQKMEAVGQLTGGIAHDFNNLLASMVSNLEIMKLKISMGNTADLGRHIDNALIASERAAALTHRLLAFSRRQTLDPKPVNVSQLVASMTDMIRRTVGPAIELVVLPAQETHTVRCDPNQLESALLNLVINARDAMPEGGTLTIATSSIFLDETYAKGQHDVSAGEYVVLSVADTGIGMTAEVAARAFDPFFTTKPLGLGTGLGLSMIYGFVKQSGGHVRIDSAPGKGTTVRLKLPRRANEESAHATRKGKEQTVKAGEAASLLIVDDEAPLRATLAEMMETLGYRATQAGEAASALRMIESGHAVDLLITDVGLPGSMNGRQLAQAAQEIRPGLQVLFITGYAEDAATRNGMLEPGMEVMSKPFSLDAFSAKVRAMLE